MQIRDEYEYEVDGQTFYVEVSGDRFIDDGHIQIIINEVNIYDGHGVLVDEDNEYYSQIFMDANEREYETEIHSSDFDYYGEMGA